MFQTLIFQYIKATPKNQAIFSFFQTVASVEPFVKRLLALLAEDI